MSEIAVPAGYYQSPAIHDWAYVVSFTPSKIYSPASLHELSATLAGIRQSGGTVRILGGQHSCSEIFENDAVIDISHLPIEFTVIDAAAGKVVASGWMHAHEFTRRAALAGLTLTALGGTDAQTLGGLIATNTAGATISTTVYDTVDWVEYLAPDPDSPAFVTVTVKRTDPAFDTVICSLGLIGFITRVGFTLVPQRYYQGGFTLKPIADILASAATIQAMCDAHDFWRVEWLPGDNPQGYLWSAQLQPTPGDPDGDYPPDAEEAQLLGAIAAYGDGAFMTPALQLVYDQMVSTFNPANAPSATGPMRNIIPVDRLASLLVLMAEWSFAPADVPRAMQCCKTYFDAHGWPNLATEIEATKCDTHHMSPWNWSGLPFIVKFNFQYLTNFIANDPVQMERVFAHLKGLWHALDAAGIAFKAHWGKVNFLTPERVARDYGMAAFKPAVVPMFVNHYLRQRLGH